MKDKSSFYVKAILAVCGAGLGVYLIYLFFDNVLNGVIKEWFYANFVTAYNDYDSNTGSEVFVRDINWAAIKSTLLNFLILFAAAVTVIIIAVSHQLAVRSRKQFISEAGMMLKTIMKQDHEDIMEVFPADYAELGTQMVQMKANMQQQSHTLKEETRRKEELITYLAHDLKTPLTSVVGYLNLLDEIKDMPTGQREKYTHIALDKANRLERLINEFFEITRYNLQQIILEKEPIDLYYMLVQMSDEFYPILEAHKNTVRIEADEELKAYGDGLKLARVFNNILKNAVAYSYPDTEILIKAVQNEQNQICISFQNHGPTIPPQKIEIIFDQFYRLDDARTTNTGGAGLGLAIASEIVEAHDGKITVTSQDDITTFEVCLPGSQGLDSAIQK